MNEKALGHPGTTPQAASGAHEPDRDLFMAETAQKFFSGQEGKPYQPSNGFEGEMFMHRWCRDCKADAAFRADPDSADGCPIIADTMVYSPGDPDYPAEWQWSARGQPVCTAFTPKDTSDRQPQTPGETK